MVAVVDGMGGYAGGADAAALAATALAEADPGRAPEDWDAWFEALSGRITRVGRAWDTPEMGATAAVLAIRPAGLVMANVGDCRIYRVAGGRLGRMSIDDRTQDPGSSAAPTSSRWLLPSFFWGRSSSFCRARAGDWPSVRRRAVADRKSVV